MSQYPYYGMPAPTAPHRGGLLAWGVVMICAGAIFTCGGIFGMAAMVSMQSTSGGAGSSALLRGVGAMLAATVMWGSLIWLGIGCCQGKRWVRPLVLVGSVLTMAGGAFVVIPLTWGFAKTFSHSTSSAATTAPSFAPGAPLPEIFVAFFSIVWGAMMIGMMVVVPAFMFHFFQKQTVKQSLEMTDPKPRWTDNVPLPLLGWVVGCVLYGLTNLLAGPYGVSPLFKTIITGPAAVAALGIIGALLIVGGWLTFRRSSLGWAMSFAAAVFMAASWGTFAFFGDLERYKQLLLDGFETTSRQNPAYFMLEMNPALQPAMFWIVAVAYGMWLRPRVAR